jgi:hypothetical protein
MDFRTSAEVAIRRWTGEFHLSQKDLAANVDVSTAAISHIINDPGYVISDDLARRIIATVDREAGTRIPALPMEIVALCHDTSFVPTENFNGALLASIKKGLAVSARRESKTSDIESVLPEHISGALIRIGDPKSPFFLIVVSAKYSDDERRALAHELEHLKQLILKGVNKHRPNPPRSSY